MRLFVGIFPDTQLRSYFRDTKQELSKFKRNFKFTAMDQMHMTIKFLGESIHPETYFTYRDNLIARVSGMKKFDYQVENLQFGFKSQVIPKMLFFKVKDNEILSELTDIATESAKGMSKYDIISKKEHKKLIHHFTFARLKSHKSRTFKDQIDEKIKNIETPDFTSKASSIAIIESQLMPEGPIYKILDDIPLK